MSFADLESNDDLVRRPENRFQKPRGLNLWTLTPQYARRTIEEVFAPDPLNPPIYYPIGNELRILKDLLREGVPTVLTGPPGIGKTTLIMSAVHQLGMPIQTFVASAASQVAELLGRPGVGGDKGELNVWHDGKLSLSARAAVGGCKSVFYLDEVIKMPSNIASILYSVIDHRQTLPLPTGEELILHNHLKMVFSYNPSRVDKLEDALRSRLTAIRLGYPPARIEIPVLCDDKIGKLCRLKSGEEVARQLIQFANVIRFAQGFEVDTGGYVPSEEEMRVLALLPTAPSTRMLVIAGRMIVRAGYSPNEAIRLFVIPSMTQDTHDSQLRPIMTCLMSLCDALISPDKALADRRDGVAMTQFESEDSAPLPEEDFGAPVEDDSTRQLAAEILREWQNRRGS